MSGLERRLLFSRFRHQIGAENAAQERERKQQSAAEITAENQTQLESLRGHVDVLGFPQFFEGVRKDLLERGTQVPFDSQLDLDIWRINYAASGEAFNDGTALRALSGFVIQARKLLPDLFAEESPWLYPNPTFYAVIFQPVSAFVPTIDGLQEVSSSPPMIYIGTEPQDSKEDKPVLSQVLGVNEAMIQTWIAKEQYESTSMLERAFLVQKQQHGHEVTDDEWPEPFEDPKVVNYDHERACFNLFMSSVKGKLDQPQPAGLDDLFSTRKVHKRLRRPAIANGPFRNASQIFNPGSTEIYRDQADQALLKFLKTIPSFAPYDAPAQAIDDLK